MIISFLLFLFLPERGFSQKCENGRGKLGEPVTFCDALTKPPDFGPLRKTINLGKNLLIFIFAKKIKFKIFFIIFRSYPKLNFYRFNRPFDPPPSLSPVRHFRRYSSFQNPQASVYFAARKDNFPPKWFSSGSDSCFRKPAAEYHVGRPEYFQNIWSCWLRNWKKISKAQKNESARKLDQHYRAERVC